jgi:hypothetical protein
MILFVFHLLSCKDSWNDLMCSFSTSTIDVDSWRDYPIFDASLPNLQLYLLTIDPEYIYWIFRDANLWYTCTLFFPKLNLCIHICCRLCIRSSKVWWKCSVHNKRSLGTSHIILMGLWCEKYELLKKTTTCSWISAGTVLSIILCLEPSVLKFLNRTWDLETLPRISFYSLIYYQI